MIRYLISHHGEKLLFLMLGLGTLGLLIAPAPCSEGVSAALSLCGNILLPSLFPFFVLSSMMIESGMATALGRYFELFMRPLFRVPGAAAPAFLLGILCGYPVGAKTAIGLYQKGLCTKTEGERLLAFCNNSGPAFILGSVGIGIWHDAKLGLLLFGCHIAASLTTGILFRFYHGGEDCVCHRSIRSRASLQKKPLSLLFVHAIQDSATTMLFLCGFVIFFAIFIRLLTYFNIIPSLASFFTTLFHFTGLPKDFFEQLLSGIFELTTGVGSAGTGTGSAAARLTLTGAMLGWAGLSVHCQVFSFLSGSGLSSLPYIMGKLIQSGIAALYTALLCYFWPYALPALLPLTASRRGIVLCSFAHMAKISGTLLIVLLILFFIFPFLGRVFIRKR